MKKIKRIFYLYKLDWQRIFKIPLATFLIVALMILPSLYAWFNIKALWDPYGNTGEIPIAIYSDDVGTTLNDKKIEVGQEVLKKLKKNDQLGWRFVKSKKAVTEGVKSGKYYAGIYIPKDFSEDLISFTKGEIKKPQIDYYFNEKINAIAPKITDKGANSLKDQVAENFISTATTTLFTALKDVGYDIEANLVSINKVKNLILITDEHATEINGYLEEIVTLHDKLPEMKEKLAKANEFSSYLPEVDALGEKIIALNDKMPELEKQAAVILTLQEKIPELQAAGNQLAEINEDFSSVEQTMNQGVSEAKEGLAIIEKVQSLWPEIEKLGSQASGTSESVLAFAKQLQTALPTIITSVDTTLDAISQAAGDVQTTTSDLQTLLDKNELTDAEKQQVVTLLEALAEHFNTQATLLNSVITLLENLQQATGSTALDSVIQQLKTVEQTVSDLATRATSLAEQAKNGEFDQIKTDISALLTSANQAAGAVQTTITNVKALNVGDSITTIVNQLIDTLTTASSLMSQVNFEQLESLLTATHGTVKNAISILEKYQAQLPAIRQELSDANTLLNGHMTQIVDAINKGADLYNNELPTVAEKLQLAANFMKNDWSSVRNDLTSTLALMNEKFPDVEKALNLADDLIQNDWPSIQAGIHKAAEAIRKGEETIDLGQVIKLMKQDIQKESDFFTNPVDLKTTTMYPIANNGSASTPFYTALCLWVGALLFSSVATTGYFLNDKQKNQFTKRETFIARMLTFLTMAIGQALIVTLGNYFLLGVDVRQPAWSVFFAVLVALSFMMIIYVLVAMFGNIGKGIGIIILVLSISGGGGNYPIQVSGKFFQMINPLLPFTYAVNLLRESAGGIYWANAWQDLIFLVCMFVGFAAVGIYLFPKVTDLQKRMSERAKQSHLFH